MSSKYIVRQPIKDAAGTIIGYEILYHGENEAFSNDNGTSSADFAAADTIYNFLTQNSTKVLKGTLNFMTFTTMLLMKKTPRLFDKQDLVIQIDDSVIIHPLSMHFVQQYAKEGYKIAVNEFQFAPRYLALLDGIDYIRINAKTANELTIRNIIDVGHSMNKRCIVTNIDSETLYQRALSLNADAMEGPYVAEKLTTKAHSSAYIQSNFFRLMVAVTRDEPNVEEVEQMIGADAENGQLRLLRPAPPGHHHPAGHYDPGPGAAEAVDLPAQCQQRGERGGPGLRGIFEALLHAGQLLQRFGGLCQEYAHFQGGGLSHGYVLHSELPD